MDIQTGDEEFHFNLHSTMLSGTQSVFSELRLRTWIGFTAAHCFDKGFDSIKRRMDQEAAKDLGLKDAEESKKVQISTFLKGFLVYF